MKSKKCHALQRLPTEADHVLHDGARAEPHNQADKGARKERDECLMHRLDAADLEVVRDPERENEEEQDEQDWRAGEARASVALSSTLRAPSLTRSR